MNFVVFLKLCDLMRFGVNCAKSHHHVISDGLIIVIKCSWPISPLHWQSTITSWLNLPIRSITRVWYRQLMWYNSLWLGRWLPHRLSKRQLLSTTVLFRKTFIWTTILNLLTLSEITPGFKPFTVVFFVVLIYRRTAHLLRETVQQWHHLIWTWQALQ